MLPYKSADVAQRVRMAFNQAPGQPAFASTQGPNPFRKQPWALPDATRERSSGSQTTPCGRLRRALRR